MGGIEHDEENDGAEENIGSTTEDSTLKTVGATLTFKDVNYVVTASTSNEKLHLLKGISGYFAAGKMTALMGSSGGMIDICCLSHICNLSHCSHQISLSLISFSWENYANGRSFTPQSEWRGQWGNLHQWPSSRAKLL